MDFSDNQVMLIKFNLPALPNLAHVNLSQNSLNAETLESSLAYNLTKLEVLDFSHNQLSGPVLPAISLLPRLRALHLQDNLLTGPVPPELASLAELSSLRLEDNRLSGSVPDGLCRRANVSVDCRRVSCAAACCRCE
jgi:Leucine-rich repeat (LRR) protein